MFHLYGLIIGIAILIGFEYFSSHQTIIPKNRLDLFSFGLIISAIIGARAYHVIDQWSFYSKNLILIPQTWNGGLGVFGGIFGALSYILVFSFIKHIPYFQLLDFISPILPQKA